MKLICNTLITAFLLAVALLFSECTRTSGLGSNDGSGSTTTNGIVVSLYSSQGLPAAGVSCRLRSADYVASISEKHSYYDLSTDSAGRIEIDSIDSGAYILEANDKNGSSAALSFSIGDSDSVVNIGKDTLRPNCIVCGNIPADMLNGHAWFIQIYGLERLAQTDPETGNFTFSDMPAGTFSIRMVSTDVNTIPIKIPGIKATSGDTITLSAYAAWKSSKKISFNTKQSGAGISSDLYGFPVLIRLNANNFDFTKAKTDGADIRFSKICGAVLPFEIDRWDAAAMLAEIWVKLDTVSGYDSSQAITMYWGNENATAVSGGKSVFDTANGYAGVWHLNSNCTDATYNANNGTPNALIDTMGIIGYCQKFNDTTASIKISGLLNKSAIVTLSAWAMLDTVKNTGAEVVSIGDGVLIRMDDSWKSKGIHGAYCVNPSGGKDSTHCITQSGQFLKKTGWHFLSYSYDESIHAQRLYIDGSLSSSSDSTALIVYTGIGTDTYIGKHGNGQTKFNFTGCIDEVCISGTARSADWIRLCYMNQRQDDKLVIFE